MAYPQRATLWHDEILITSGTGPLVSAFTANQFYDREAYINNAADGDTFTQSFRLVAGTYSFSILGCSNNNRGKLDWYIDDVLIASGHDWYSASITNNVIKTVDSISVTEDGRHVLKGVVNGKNSSSSGYYICLTKYWFVPDADTVEV